jgi:hypothetical protein
MAQLGFFDADKRLEALSAKGDPLEAIDRLVPWESFRAEIEAVVLAPDERSLRRSDARKFGCPGGSSRRIETGQCHRQHSDRQDQPEDSICFEPPVEFARVPLIVAPDGVFHTILPAKSNFNGTSHYKVALIRVRYASNHQNRPSKKYCLSF